jgi:hypothetical protein
MAWPYPSPSLQQHRPPAPAPTSRGDAWTGIAIIVVLVATVAGYFWLG